ncbi:MAG TPA: GGDEF domain-containing protein [Treponemataceae bacterium]|nr:GGDEF domain-containing protein [Treponemataceae bacterium]
MAFSSDVLAQFNQLEKSGALDALDDLRKENRELERIITDAALLVAFSDVNTMLDFMIQRLLDHFIPQFLGFLVFPPRGSRLRQYCYRNLKESTDIIDPLYYNLLKERFSKNPGNASFETLATELGQELFGKDFRDLEPEHIFPMCGIGGVYGIVILGKKIVGKAYTELEQNYIDRMIRFLSVSIQNGLHYESSITDPKTELFTHDYFIRRLDETIAQCQRHSRNSGVIMIDVDNFKKFNDTWGHVTGDIVLSELAKVLKRTIRAEDCAARFGGEEFSVLVSECDLAGLFLVAERIRKGVEAIKLHIDDKIVSVTISLGGRLIDPKSETGSLILIGDADKALYLSKSSGRNRTTLYSNGLLEKALVTEAISHLGIL